MTKPFRRTMALALFWPIVSACSRVRFRAMSTSRSAMLFESPTSFSAGAGYRAGCSSVKAPPAIPLRNATMQR